jgi:tyrosine-protein phosphatase YwqE
MASDKFFVTDCDGLEPLTVTIPRTVQITGESRSKVYELMGNGTYEAVKSGSRTLIIFESIKRRMANLPRAKIKASKNG